VAEGEGEQEKEWEWRMASEWAVLINFPFPVRVRCMLYVVCCMLYVVCAAALFLWRLAACRDLWAPGCLAAWLLAAPAIGRVSFVCGVQDDPFIIYGGVMSHTHTCVCVCACVCVCVNVPCVRSKM